MELPVRQLVSLALMTRVDSQPKARRPDWIPTEVSCVKGICQGAPMLLKRCWKPGAVKRCGGLPETKYALLFPQISVSC